MTIVKQKSPRVHGKGGNPPITLPPDPPIVKRLIVEMFADCKYGRYYTKQKMRYMLN